MATIGQIISQIRFGLEQLSARNSHHDFEHLCRHLSRLRICSNILPATGPVSAGGDQGRDFETFRTYLNNNLTNSAFIGLASANTMVFACTLQKTDIPGKVKRDVAAIVASGTEVQAIHYFCGTDVPVSNRHELQKWAIETHSIELEIHDGQSISELLADREIFWIAEEYLKIPSEIFPHANVDNENEWYSLSIEKWKQSNIRPFNWADFTEIKLAARHAIYTHDFKQDISFWANLLKTFTKDNPLLQLKRNIIYEIAFINLKGFGSLIGFEEQLREYFSDICQLEEHTDLENTTNLLNYCIGAFLGNKIRISKDELGVWQDELIAKVEDKLNTVTTKNSKCLFLDLKGMLSISIDPRNPVRPDLSNAIKWWEKLAEIVKDTPLYPLERLADRLVEFVKFMDEPPEYYEFTQKIDNLLSIRSGNFTAASKCRDRAIIFYDKGQMLKAINQLHQAKIKWFANETLYGSLLSMLFIARCYFELKLTFAAKYYALAAAFLAINSENPDYKAFSSRGIFLAASCDYYQGSWVSFLELTKFGLAAHELFAKDAYNLDRHEELDQVMSFAVTVMAITEKINPHLLEFVTKAVKEWKCDVLTIDVLPEARKIFKDRSLPEIWDLVTNLVMGVPLGDVGSVRKANWAELGIMWKVEWTNDYDTTPIAEQFISVLQIFLADIADSNIDLSLLKTNVDINISLANTTKATLSPLISNEGRKWKIEYPNYSISGYDIEQLQNHIFSIATIILAEVSLVPISFYNQALQNCFRNGISMKVFVGKPYESLYRDFISSDVFNSSDRVSKHYSTPQTTFIIKESKELAWMDKPGNGYSKKLAEEMLTNRYTRSMPRIKYTLNNLLSDSNFKKTVETLRAEGWLDWHILSSMATLSVNYRVELAAKKQKIKNAKRNIEILDKLFYELLNKPENENDSLIPASEFTVEKLRFSLTGNTLSTIKILGLESRQRTPDFPAISHFLGTRYNYWSDDIEHEDPFVFNIL